MCQALRSAPFISDLIYDSHSYEVDTTITPLPFSYCYHKTCLCALSLNVYW